MDNFKKMLEGYRNFRHKYVNKENSVMAQLSTQGQHPKMLIVSCCDSRVDPGLILNCDPGDLFIVRNVANIIPPFERDFGYHGTSAALEFGINFLKIRHLVIMGHTQCGGLSALFNGIDQDTDFIEKWVSIIDNTKKDSNITCEKDQIKTSLQASYENCMTFPWIRDKVDKKELSIHRWFFEIATGEILCHQEENSFIPLSSIELAV